MNNLEIKFKKKYMNIGWLYMQLPRKYKNAVSYYKMLCRAKPDMPTAVKTWPDRANMETKFKPYM